MGDEQAGRVATPGPVVLSGLGLALAIAAVVGVAVVSIVGLLLVAVVIGLCDVGLGSTCTPEEDTAASLAGYGALAVLAVAVAGVVWVILARRRLVLLAVLAAVGAVALFAGAAAGVEADRGRCQRFVEFGYSGQSGVRPGCDTVSSFTRAPQAIALVLGTLLTAVAVWAVVQNWRRSTATKSRESVSR